MEGTYGKAVIGKLKKMKVLIIGLRGLGCEVAKNLILAGPKAVVLHDDDKVVIADLGANFYLLPEDVGSPRAASVLNELSDANPNTRVSVHTGEMAESFLAGFDVVVSTDDAPQAEQIRRNSAVRDTGKFIYACQNGVFASVFSDFGPAHQINDPDGSPVNTIVLDEIIVREGQPTVCVIDSTAHERHGFYTGDTIKLTEVLAGDEKEPSGGDYSQPGVPVDGKSNTYNANFVIKEYRQEYKRNGKLCKKNVHSKFEIADCSGAGAWKHGGMATGVKVPVTKVYNSLQAECDKPSMEQGVIDFLKFGCQNGLHYARLGLWAFQAKNNGELPKLHDQKDAEAVADEAKAILAAHVEAKTGIDYFTELSEEDLNHIKQVSLYARTELTAISALFGGVVAQEVVKFTGKYTPIRQWIHYDAFELLQPSVPVDAAPLGCRYDHQISLFGKAIQTKIGKARTFLVGCGALGCEFLKGLAMSGYACGGGAIHVTDMDTIELSNLSRQFLFRRKHVNKPKASSAASVVVGMNPEIKAPLNVKLIKVAPDTEDVFDAKFWNNLDFVVNALDNLQAREYVDGRCVLFGLPLFESGTLGTQANTVISLPHVTKSYSEGATSGEGQGIAQCTLKSFPSLPLHCIEYAKEKFDESFTGGAQKLADFLEDREEFIVRNEQEDLGELASLQELMSWLDIYRSISVETCVQLAVNSLIKRFRDGIKDLQASFPRDARQIDKATGADMGPFWRGHKRFPQAVSLDMKDDMQADYVWHATCIFCDIFDLKNPTRDESSAIAGGLSVADWKDSGVKVALDDEKGGAADDDEELVAKIKADLRALDMTSLSNQKVTPTDFEKDDDTNHHIDWITSASCLRAWNYEIKQPSRQECRMVAGKIIPAIATTTAAITGFIQVEMLKYVMGSALKTYKAITLDLATNSMVFESLPDPTFTKSDAKKGIVAKPDKFTCWDHTVIVRGKMSVEAFIQVVSDKYGVTPTKMFKNGSDKMLYESRNPYKGMARMASTKIQKVKNAKQRIKFQTILDNNERWLAANSDNSVDLVAKYESVYGPILGQNFVALQGEYQDANFQSVVMPVIKYVFA